MDTNKRYKLWMIIRTFALAVTIFITLIPLIAFLTFGGDTAALIALGAATLLIIGFTIFAFHQVARYKALADSATTSKENTKNYTAIGMSLFLALVIGMYLIPAIVDAVK